MLAFSRLAGAPFSRPASATRHAVAVAARALKWRAMASAMVTKLPLNMLTPDFQTEHSIYRRTAPAQFDRQDAKSCAKNGALMADPDYLESAFAIGGPVNSDSMVTSTRSPTPMLVPASGMPPEIPKSDRRSTPRAEKPMRAWGSIGLPT